MNEDTRESLVLAERVKHYTGGQPSKLHQVMGNINEVLPLAGGDPDLETPPHVLDAVRECLNGSWTHYTPVRGVLSLREAIAEREMQDNNVVYKPESEILVSSGAQEAIFLAMQAMVNSGDEVLIPSPYYTSYRQAVEMSGGRVLAVPTHEEDDFILQPEVLSDYISPNTRLLVLLSPGMPCSSVIPRSILDKIAEVVARENLFVIHDQLYHKFQFSGSEHVAFASLPGMRERTLTIGGVSKTYAMTGWRVGWSMGPEKLIGAMEALKSPVSICATALSQKAAEAALTGPQDVVFEHLQIYSQRRSIILEAFKNIGITHGRWLGGLCTMANIAPTGMNSEQFAVRLLEDVGVLVSPGNGFGPGGDNYIRVSLLQSEEMLKKALGKLAVVWPDYVKERE